MSIVAPAIPLGAVTRLEQLRVGGFALPPVFGWTPFVVLVPSLQFGGGAAGSRRQSRRILLAECILVFGGAFVSLTVNVDWPARSLQHPLNGSPNSCQYRRDDSEAASSNCSSWSNRL
jgi:hypothetical protein